MPMYMDHMHKNCLKRKTVEYIISCVVHFAHIMFSIRVGVCQEAWPGKFSRGQSTRPPHFQFPSDAYAHRALANTFSNNQTAK